MSVWQAIVGGLSALLKRDGKGRSFRFGVEENADDGQRDGSARRPRAFGAQGARPAKAARTLDRMERGLLVFSHTSEVIRAERYLREKGFAVEVMGPPPDLQTGCDMVLVFSLMEELAVHSALEAAALAPLRIVPLRDLLLEPVALFHTVRYGRFLMVRAANMKMTVELAPSGKDGGAGRARIVNVSGGGCPDVPYLAGLLVGQDLDAAQEPALHGRTLCSYSLQKAFEETRRITAGDLSGIPDVADTSSMAGGEGDGRPDAARPQGVTFAPEWAAEWTEAMQDSQTSLNGRTPLPSRSGSRSWLVCGSVPDAAFPLSLSRWRLEGDMLFPLDPSENSPSEAAGHPPALPVRRGTPALMAAALLTCQALEVPPPEALLTGDIGTGEGSRSLYRHLSGNLLPGRVWAGLTFHYLFPDVDGHNRVLMAVDALEGVPGSTRPMLVADAGFMYAAKMSGYASSYDLFTPDAGELAFLADEKAPHPFYTRGFLLASGHSVPELAAEAARHGDSARLLLVKGAQDVIVREGRVLASVSSPCVPAMEPIGGTGDIVTGMVTGFLTAGWSLPQACVAAAGAARLAGAMARPGPATQVAELLPFVGEAVLIACRTVSWPQGTSPDPAS